MNLGYADRLKEIALALGASEPLVQEGGGGFSCDIKVGGFWIMLFIPVKEEATILTRVYRMDNFKALGMIDFVPDEKIPSIIHYLTNYELVEADK